MLEAIRSHAQGWLVKVILGLIAVTFALFGMDSYLQGDRRGGAIAEVGDIGITRESLADETRRQADRMREALGPAFDPSVTETRDFRQQVLEALIDRFALIQEAQKRGLTAPDGHLAAVLAQIPAFQDEGQFSRARYEAVLRQNGRTPAQFENELRQAFMLEAMTAPIELAAFSSRRSIDRLAQSIAQQREIAWVDIPASAIEARIGVSDTDIRRHYEANPQLYTVPEQIRAEYVVLDAAVLASRIEVGETAIAEYYDAHRNEFGEPEQRSASHILIMADKAAGADARARAKAKAESVRQTLQKSPGRFSELARAESQDPGSAEEGGSLGSFGRGMMVKPFEDAVFDMKVGEISGVVETDFGYHVIRLDGIEPARSAPLSEVRPMIVEALRAQQAQRQFADAAENFSNLVYEDAASLQAAAALAKSAVVQTDWISVGTAPAPLDRGALADALFSAESIKSKQNTEAIEVQPGRLAAARVIAHREAKRKPLEEVAPEIETALRAEQRTRLLAEQGQARVAALKKGEEADLRWSDFQVADRQPTAILSTEGVKVVFRARADSLPAYVGFMRPDGQGYRIVRISRVIEPDVVDPALVASIEAGVLQAQQRADRQAMTELARSSQRVKIRDNAVEGR